VNAHINTQHGKTQRSIIGLTFATILIVLPLYAYKVYLKQDYTDFSVYYKAGLRAQNAQWNEIYNLGDGASPFRYLPALIPFFRPLARLSLAQAQMLWYFLQFLAFGLGFLWIYQTLKLCLHKQSAKRALTLTCLSLLFILRFCLDTFTIGQSSSLLFLGFCFGLYCWVRNKTTGMVVGLLIPTVFKIGPGFLYGLFLSAKSREKFRAFKVFILGIFALSTFPLLMTTSWSISKKLWMDWAQIVANDSVYYDSSHYGSQSINSFLLRGVNWGWFSLSIADRIHLCLSVIICGMTLAFWLLRRPRSLLGRASFFSLGLFPYIWVMPETFKYSLTPLAIPVALILASFSGAKGKHDLRLGAGHGTKIGWFALIFGALSLSIAGRDVVGPSLFFSNQIHSIPLLATLFLAMANIQLAWKESINSGFARFLSQLLHLNPKVLGPWEELPSRTRECDYSVLIPVPLQSSACLDAELLSKLVLDSYKCLSEISGKTFEILLILSGDLYSELHPIVEMLQQIVRSRLETNPGMKSGGMIKIIRHTGFAGRGTMLRAGFLKCRGKNLIITDAEQFTHSNFFPQALKLLQNGYALVRANRRLPDSHFEIPVKLLPLVYGRHRLGLWFNQIVRLVLPIQTSDTHSGTFAVTWQLAADAFAVQSSPGFLFDLELSLAAIGHGYREKDLPVSVGFEIEKNFRRIFLETLTILFGLPALALRYRRGCYRALPKLEGITADDWGLSPGVNAGILKLAQQGVVKRVSMMANCPYLEDHLDELRALPDVQLGLHFNLTYGKPCQKDPNSALPLIERAVRGNGYPEGGMISSPGRFMLEWLNPLKDRKSQRAYVQAELSSQLEKIRKLGVHLQYLDGHHHIHLVPGLIDTLAELIQKEGIQRIRLPYDRSLWKTAQAPIVLLSLLARRRFKKNGFQLYACIYPQKGCFQDHGILRAALAKNPQAEVIVHPAEKNDLGMLEFPDSYAEARVLEYQALRMLGFGNKDIVCES